MLVSIETQVKLMNGFETFMQLSIVVPMVVVWRKRRYFSLALKTISWYVYLSAISVITGKLAAYYFHNNQLIIVGFNMSKLLLFSAAYAKVLVRTRWYQLLRIAIAGTLCLIAGLLFYDWQVSLTIARMAQTTVLAGFSLAYLDQSLNTNERRLFTGDPLWLLSVGNIIYAACVITACNMQLFQTGAYETVIYFAFISCANLILNSVLTLAFLRAEEWGMPSPEAPPALVPVFVQA